MPQKITLTITEKDRVPYQTIAALTGNRWSPSGLRNIVRDGLIPNSVNGGWLVVPTIAGLFTHAYALVDKGKSTIEEEKLLKLRAEREMVEIELARCRREVIEANIVEREWANIVLPVRERLLSLSSRLSPRLEICKGQAEIETCLSKEIRDILDEMSRPVFYERTDAQVEEATKPTEDK